MNKGDKTPPCPKCGKIDTYLISMHTQDLDGIFNWTTTVMNVEKSTTSQRILLWLLGLVKMTSVEDYRKLLDAIMSVGLDRIDNLTDDELRKVVLDEDNWSKLLGIHLCWCS